MVTNDNKLTYPDIVRLCELVAGSKYSDKYKLDLMGALVRLKG